MFEPDWQQNYDVVQMADSAFNLVYIVRNENVT